MAVLSNSDRALITAEFQRIAENIINTGSMSKAQLRAAFDAADDWADSNATAFNTALPAAARTALSVKQKTFLLAYVIFKRAGIL